MKPFRFGVQVGRASSREDWAERARQAEDWGYSVLQCADHLDGVLPPLVALMAAADATTTLRVGTLVLNNDLRHPALLAREAAALDLLSGGRFELGLGAGHAFPEYARIGLPFDPPGVRIGRLAESAQIVRRLLAGESVHFSGRHYQLAGEQCYPTPKRPVPILVGGGRRVLGQAARYADIAGFGGLGRTLADGNTHECAYIGPAAVDAQVAWVRERAGDRLEDLEFHALVQHVEITDHSRQAEEALVEKMAGLALEDLPESPYFLIGSADHIVEKLQATRARWGHSYFTVRWTFAEAFAPIVARLAVA